LPLRRGCRRAAHANVQHVEAPHGDHGRQTGEENQARLVENRVALIAGHQPPFQGCCGAAGMNG